MKHVAKGEPSKMENGDNKGKKISNELRFREKRIRPSYSVNSTKGEENRGEKLESLNRFAAV